MPRHTGPLKGFALALGFCTRFSPASPDASSESTFLQQLAASLGWFPVVGGLIGLAMVLPWSVGILSGAPWIQALLALAISVWLTRALHWDGLADLADGWGSNARGEAFWTILKDSRSGVFAIVAVSLALAGQLVVFQSMLAAKTWAALVWCPILGRCGIITLCLLCRDYPRPGMGQAFLQSARLAHLAVPLAVSIAAGVLISWTAVLFGWLLLLACQIRMRSLARRNQGCNGDFLGATVICGEICAGLGWALAL